MSPASQRRDPTPRARMREAMGLLIGLLLGAIGVIGTAAPAQADVILTTQNLNEALKNLERLRQRTTPATDAATRADALFALGLEAEKLATLMTDEVIAHGSQEQLLLDLGLARTKELSVAIAYSREKQKFFYDGAAFRESLAAAPTGPRAPDAQYKVIETEFYQSAGTNIDAVLAAAKAKTAFLTAHPGYAQNAEVHLMLAIDYRDLMRLYAQRGDATQRDQYRDRVRQAYRTLMQKFPKSEQADIARKLLARFDQELAAGR